MRTMGRKVYVFFSAACIILLLFAATFAAVRIGGEIRDNTRRAQLEFDRMLQHLSTFRNTSLQDETFRQAVRDAFWDAPTLAALLASSSSGPELAIEKDSGLLSWDNGIPCLNPSMAYSARGLSATVRTASTGPLAIEALAQRFDHSRMRVILAQALIILIASVLFALMIFLVARSAGKTGTNDKKNRKIIQDGPQSMALDEALPALSNEVLHGDVLNEPQSPSRTEIPAPETAAPEGLYNPSSGIGWEAYLPERLNAELHRAASFEQDLVLLIWDFVDTADCRDIQSALQPAARLRAALAGELVRFFSFRDLSFEFGPSGASVILPNMDLDHGLRMAEEFIQQITRRGPEDLCATSLRCGVASRHGRLLEPGRLLLEAQGALKRARHDPVTAVIAFRSDPERYRELLKRE